MTPEPAAVAWLIAIPLWVKVMLAVLCGFTLGVWFWIGDE